MNRFSLNIFTSVCVILSHFSPATAKGQEAFLLWVRTLRLYRIEIKWGYNLAIEYLLFSKCSVNLHGDKEQQELELYLSVTLVLERLRQGHG